MGARSGASEIDRLDSRRLVLRSKRLGEKHKTGFDVSIWSDPGIERFEEVVRTTIKRSKNQLTLSPKDGALSIRKLETAVCSVHELSRVENSIHRILMWGEAFAIGREHDIHLLHLSTKLSKGDPL